MRTPPTALDILDDALTAAREQGLRGNDIALRLVNRKHVLGVTGEAVVDPEGRTVVLFTVRQVRRMRKTLRAALRAEAADPTVML